MHKAVLVSVIVLGFGSCTGPMHPEPQAADSVPSSGTQHMTFKAVPALKADTAAFYRTDTLSTRLLRLLAENKPRALADWVHEDLGICFSPYAYADSARMRCMTAKGLRYLATIPDSTRRWGEQDGTGEPLRLSWNQYRRRFIWDKDYSQLGTRRNAPSNARGNSLLNVYTQFPDAAVVEYHVPGNERYAFMDWGSLYLVYVFRDGRWWLRAIVHDQWTI
jgi:hypothetical protein